MADRVSFSCKHNTPRLIALRYALPVLWALVIFLLSLTSTPPVIPGVLGWDKLLHAGAFALLAVFVAQLLTIYYQNHIKTYLMTGIICIGCGALVELFQLIMHAGRTAEWLDLFADILGVVVACVIFRLVYGILLKHDNSPEQSNG